MQRFKLSMIAVAMLFTMLLSACSGNTANNSAEVLCDVEKFANISSAELVEILGTPDNIDKTTTNGFAEFPCVYYDYNNAEDLGEVSFILINDTVVKLVSYNTYSYNNGKNLLSAFNLKMGETGAKDETDTYARYRCPTETVDDLWITNIDSSANTFGTLQVTYDMFYFEEWYMPMDTSEESNYQWWTQETVKTLLKSPNTADFPNILEWSISKNKFYAIAQSYVDAQNSFGAEIRSNFTFVYTVGTSNIVYAVFDGEVIADNGYVKTETLVSQLIDQSKTDAALSVNTNKDTNTDTKNDAETVDKPSANETPQETSKDNTTSQKPTNQTEDDTPTVTPRPSVSTDSDKNPNQPQIGSGNSDTAHTHSYGA